VFYIFNLLHICICIKANSSFWKKKLQAAVPLKKAQGTSRATARRKRPPTEELLRLNNESEVELDSLGLFFMQLIDADSSQEEAETSHADAVEVTIISSGSEPLPR
jgi:hypothetical protein